MCLHGLRRIQLEKAKWERAEKAAQLTAISSRVAAMEASIVSLQRQCFHKDEALSAVNMLSPGDTYLHSKTPESSSRSCGSSGRRGAGNHKSNPNDTRATPAADAAKERERERGRERGSTTSGGGRGGGDRDMPGMPFGVQSSPSMPPPTIDAPSTAPRPTRNASPETHASSPEMRVDQSALDMIEDEEIWRAHDMQELAHAFGLHLEEEPYPHNPDISHNTCGSGESDVNDLSSRRSRIGSSALRQCTLTHPHALRQVSPDILHGARPHHGTPPSGGGNAPRQSGGGSSGGRREGDKKNIDSRNPPNDVLKSSHGKDYNGSSKRASESPNDATRNALPQRRISYASLC